ncbi:MAG: sigma 54-interacting transcriptional regulator [Hyphomonadaceae bacterium]|nr:sigma 54-interacting transcriptional regulator [Hyphomonadaceae bacterium]
MSARILLADDDASLRFVLQQALTNEGYAVRATSNVATLSKWLRDGEGDLVLSDVYMGESCIFDELPKMRMAKPDVPIIVMSAQSTVATALSASNAGAFDYVPKPFDLEHLLALIRAALQREPDARLRSLSARAEKDEALPVIGRSPAMQDAYRIMARVAGTELTVLIEGESGVGKERIARTVHENSRRARGPFVAVSLAGASAEHVESALFAPNLGRMTQAQGGTLFLEDVDDLPSAAQTRLAGLLHEDCRAADIRLIAASKVDLSARVREGTFRQDLFHRLSVVTIRIPPLRERLEDVGDLARAFLVRARREGLPAKTLDASAVERLEGYAFPGNVRELENLLRRAIALTPSPVLTARDVDAHLSPTSRPDLDLEGDGRFETSVSERLAAEFASAQPGLPQPGLYDRLLAEVERPLIVATLRATQGNQIRAAAVLGINRNTLRKKIQVLGIPTGRSD